MAWGGNVRIGAPEGTIEVKADWLGRYSVLFNGRIVGSGSLFEGAHQIDWTAYDSNGQVVRYGASLDVGCCIMSRNGEQIYVKGG